MLKHGELHLKGAGQHPESWDWSWWKHTWLNLPAVAITEAHWNLPDVFLKKHLFTVAESGLFFSFLRYLCIYLFLAALGPHCCAGPSLAAEWGPLSSCRVGAPL